MMGNFEYVVTFIGFFLAIGLTRLVTDSVKFFQLKQWGKISWLHTHLVLLMVVMHMQYWIGSARELNGIDNEPVPFLILFYNIIPIILLIACVESMFPESYFTDANKQTEGEQAEEDTEGNRVISMKNYYWSNHQTFYAIIVAYIMLAALIDFLPPNEGIVECSGSYIFGCEATILRLVGAGIVSIACLKLEKQKNWVRVLIHFTILTIITVMLFYFMYEFTPSINL